MLSNTDTSVSCIILFLIIRYFRIVSATDIIVSTIIVTVNFFLPILIDPKLLGGAVTVTDEILFRISESFGNGYGAP